MHWSIGPRLHSIKFIDTISAFTYYLILLHKFLRIFHFGKQPDFLHYICLCLTVLPKSATLYLKNAALDRNRASLESLYVQKRDFEDTDEETLNSKTKAATHRQDQSSYLK